MKKLLAIAFAISLVTFACSANGESSDSFESYQAAIKSRVGSCLHAENLAAMNECRQKFELAARERMEGSVKTLSENYRAYEPALLPFFTAAQEAWEAHAQQKCSFETYYSHNREAETAARSHCMERQYLARADYLEFVLKHP